MATQSDDDPEKRANDTNELSATVQSTLFHLHGDFVLSFVSRVLFSQRSQSEVGLRRIMPHIQNIVPEIQVSAQMCIINEFTPF